MTSSTATVGCSRHRDGQKRHLPEGRFSTIQVESTLKPHTCFRCSSTNATISILHAPPRLSPKHSAAYQLTSHGWESAAAAVYAQHAVEPYIPNPAPTLGANTATAPSAQLRNGRTELPNEHHRHTPLHSCSHRQLVRPSSRSHRVLDARRCREDRAAVCRGRAVGHADLEVLFFPKAYAIFAAELHEDNAVLVKGRVNWREDKMSVFGGAVAPLDLSNVEMGGEEEPF